MKIIFKKCETGWWIAHFKYHEMRGMVESGKTKQDSFNELMKSLELKLAYDNNLKHE